MPTYDDDDDNASNESGSDANDNDENMDDADEGDGDVEMDDGDDADDGDADDNDGDEDGEEGDGDGADDDEHDDHDDNDDNDDNELPDSPSIPKKAHVRNQSKAGTPSAHNTENDEQSKVEGENSHETIRTSTTHSPKTPNARAAPIFIRPSLRPEIITATTYDIVPTIAAPQSTSINAITALPDMRWVFTGGSDGYIRKFNWIDTVNSKLMLTVAQRHPFVDSVIKAGVLQSYWENEDPTIRTPVRTIDATPALSPVYSLAVERQALWLLSGDETGIIKLQTVRHREGECITTLRKHSSAVSVLVLSPDEKSVLSGGWDKAVHDWDLNTGSVKRTYGSAAGQISAIEARPLSTLPVPQITGGPLVTSKTFSSNNNDKTKANVTFNGNEPHAEGISSDQTGPTDPEAPAYDDMDSLFGDDDAGPMNNGLGDDDDDDEFSRAIASAPKGQQTGDDDNPLDISDDMTSKSTTVTESDQAKIDIDTATQATSDSKTAEESSTTEVDGPTDELLPISDDILPPPQEAIGDPENNIPSSETTFLDASIAGTLRIWDRRMPNPLATITPRMGTPPWCMSATWSPDGNCIYVGRRNNCVEEYSLHKGLRDPSRTFRLPGSSQKVSALKAMPNGRHLICASHDIMRLYDLRNQDDESNKQHNVVPFLIIPGHRTGVISQLYLDPTGRFLISTAGNRGWYGPANPPEVMLGYEVVCIP